MSENVAQQKQPQQSSVSSADLLREIKGVSAAISALASRVESLENVGKNDKEVEPPTKKNYNDDPGPYAKPVYDKKCSVCGRPFKTENASVGTCPDCALAYQEQQNAKMDRFNKE